VYLAFILSCRILVLLLGNSHTLSQIERVDRGFPMCNVRVGKKLKLVAPVSPSLWHT